MENLITIEAKSYGIEEQKANELIGNLPQIQSERSVLQEQYNEVIKLDIEEANTSKIAKELRLKIVKNRTQGIGVWHKTTKDFFLKGGQFVDAIKRKEEAINIQMEEMLEQIEKHAENKEKERLAKLQSDRLELISPYLENTFGLDLAIMSEEMFENFLVGSKQKYEAKIEAERLEAERIEKERLAEIERQKAIEIENAKLKAEAEAKEKELAKRNELLKPYFRYIRDYNKVLAMDEKDFQQELKNLNKEAIETMKFEADQERKRQQAIQDAEKEKQARIDAENKLRAKAEADAKAKADVEKEAEKLAKAPTKKQLTIWVDSFELPNTNVDNETSKEIIEKFESFKKWSKSIIEKL